MIFDTKSINQHDEMTSIFLNFRRGNYTHESNPKKKICFQHARISSENNFHNPMSDYRIAMQDSICRSPAHKIYNHVPITGMLWSH